MQHTQRKSAPGVKAGKVQKKNRHALSPNIFEHRFEDLVIQRRRPLSGWYHAASISDVKRWIARIPDWSSAAKGINAILLGESGWGAFGTYYEAGVIRLNPWLRDEAQSLPRQDSWLLEKLGCTVTDEEWIKIWLSPDQTRAMTLLGVFLHELGHHVDRMSTRRQFECANGEPYAVHYELRRQQELWRAYVEEFGFPNGPVSL